MNLLIASALVFARVNQPDFTVLHFSDTHAGLTGAPTGVNSNYFVANIQSIVDSNASWNSKMALFPGDNFEQSGDNGNLLNPGYFLSGTNLPAAIQPLRTAGISLFPSSGNHDGGGFDEVMPFAFTNIFPISWFQTDTSFSSVRSANDTRDAIFFQTNSGMRMMFLSIRWVGDQTGQVSDASCILAYNPYVTWAVSNCNFFSNHFAIVQTHSMVDEFGGLSFSDTNSDPNYIHIGPGPSAWTNALATCQNITAIVVGHERMSLLTTTTLTAADGHAVPILKFNTQSARVFGLSTNGATVQLIRFIPNERRFTIKTWDGNSRRYLTDGEWGVIHSQSFALPNVPMFP